ncbi:MAG: methionine ABC transporter ATP-binding protein [Idiomarinaceae bacterium]|uniref:Methionine ABC transporter ATP-binding protein n=1 Tax=Pseudidiomarina aquimaris TaxID=641841 RepID=A0A432XEL9_9GAMM|nr:ABC transporter ATP-binding protein [Pseudidiomarina aquimaris]MBG22323.1 methionine ABC transporter ATP-binding protein [Idiomarinaceae bacterium]RUO47188.1 methionine ABC transporter ATP-binding protein [Pseudidiomarina aquimaris]|tara:strand:- start:1886 stop:2584 length:699 start_codon:yes stop_codon:yes gene_type:complete
MSTCIELKQLQFKWPGAQLPLLSIPELTIARGERVLLRGASGSGKSTLLGLIAGIHTTGAGQVKVLGQDLAGLNQHRRDQLRANEIGYIFQQFNLLPYLSARANVTLACQFAPARRKRLSQQSIEQEAKQLLTRLGLTPEQQQQPSHQLSVGQQQRVAAARALLGSPALIIADEPTSALDQAHRDNFIQLLFEACDAQNTTLLFVTHDATLAPLFPRAIELSEINQGAVADV